MPLDKQITLYDIITYHNNKREVNIMGVINKQTVLIITFSLFSILYLTWHVGRLYENQLTQEKIDTVVEERLATCITQDFQYIPSDWCLYGQSGYEVNINH